MRSGEKDFWPRTFYGATHEDTDNPVSAIAAYLRPVVDEADKRGYNFNRNKIVNTDFSGKIPVTSGQIEYEFKHLLGKLERRNPDLYERLRMVKDIEFHPLLQKVCGNVEAWEVIQPKHDS